MKNILVILNHANVTQLQTVEAVSATMVLATFGSNVKVLLQNQALTLLQNDMLFDSQKSAFKLASNLVDGFEFYDIETLYILTKDMNHPYVLATSHQLDAVQLNPEFLQQFDHILYW